MGLREKAERILRGKFSTEKYPEIEPEIIYDDDSTAFINKNSPVDSFLIEDEFGGDIDIPEAENDFIEHESDNIIIDEIPVPFFSEDNLSENNILSELNRRKSHLVRQVLMKLMMNLMKFSQKEMIRQKTQLMKKKYHIMTIFFSSK